MSDQAVDAPPRMVPDLLREIERLSAPELLRLKSMLVFNLRDQMIRTAIFNQARNRVEGDYFEFGVWRGASLMLAYHTFQYAKQFFGRLVTSAHAADLWTHRFVGFDSFEGLPEPTGEDVGVYTAGDYAAPLHEVRQALADNGVDLDRMVLVKGFFDRTLTDQTYDDHKLDKASIVHIDVDFYASTKSALRFVRRALVDGSIIIFDDWYLFRGDPDKGQQKAAREWLNENPHIRLDEYMNSGWSKAFLVRMS